MIELEWSHVTFPYVLDAAAVQEMLLHCAQAQYVWNLAVEQHSHWYQGRKAAPGFAAQCRQLTEARRETEWLGSGNADVQQQALKDFAQAKQARFTSGFGEPTWRKKYRHEGFRDKNSRKSQAEFVCSSCGFTCNADTNAATNVAAGQGGIPRPRRSAGAGGMTTATSRSGIREPQPTWVGIPLF
ncbi:zinc ribbon domain-containing protein [Streptomyces mirabilis]|uniref:zinc ribbon domain-containing protein n=1 Tax=Streptomyces mirabilis TaxID=68239 RepID=UPI0036C0E2A1